MKISTAFDYGILTYAVKNNILKPIALYYLIKAKYKHSIIYNYTPNKLAKLAKLHHKTILRYVKKLEQHGFVSLKNNHLHFTGRHKIEIDEPRGHKIVQTRPYTSFEGILRRINYVIIVNNISKQKFRIATRYGKGIDDLNVRTKRKAIRQAKLEKPSLENSDKAIISTTNAEKLFNVTRATAHRILKDLKDNNFLKFLPVINEIDTRGNTKYVSGLGYYFNKGKSLYQYLGQEIQDGSYLKTI